VSIAAIDFGDSMRVSVVGRGGALQLADLLTETPISVNNASVEEIALIFNGARSSAWREAGIRVDTVVCCVPSDSISSFSPRAYLAGLAVGLASVSVIQLSAVVRSATGIKAGHRFAVINARRSGVTAEIVGLAGAVRTIRSSLDYSFLMQPVSALLGNAADSGSVTIELAGEICDRWWGAEGENWLGDFFATTPAGWIAISFSASQKCKIAALACQRISGLMSEVARESPIICVVVGDGARRIEALACAHGKEGVTIVTPSCAVVHEMLVEHVRHQSNRIPGGCTAAIDILIDPRSAAGRFDQEGRIEDGWHKMRMMSGKIFDLHNISTSLHQGGVQVEVSIKNAKRVVVVLGEVVSRRSTKHFDIRLQCCEFEDGSVGIKASSGRCIEVFRVTPTGVEQARFDSEEGDRDAPSSA
jgi:hypothetical protein